MTVAKTKKNRNIVAKLNVNLSPLFTVSLKTNVKMARFINIVPLSRLTIYRKE